MLSVGFTIINGIKPYRVLPIYAKNSAGHLSQKPTLVQIKSIDQITNVHLRDCGMVATALIILNGFKTVPLKQFDQAIFGISEIVIWLEVEFVHLGRGQ